MEKSRPYFGSHPDEEQYEAFVTRYHLEIDNDTVSGMSEAYEFRDAFYKTQKNVIL